MEKRLLEFKNEFVFVVVRETLYLVRLASKQFAKLPLKVGRFVRKTCFTVWQPLIDVIYHTELSDIIKETYIMKRSNIVRNTCMNGISVSSKTNI